jgi:dolichyl-phosphate beta-glucosyltransferase
VANEHLLLSLILPAYNEAGRLPPYLAAVRTHLDACYGPAYEVLVVDDGSRDALPAAVRRLAADWPQLSLLEHGENRGKGAAVRTGILAARGRRILFADADGATPIEEQQRLADALEAGADLAVGSRLLRAEGVTRSRTPIRRALGLLFTLAARTIVGIPVLDPQCGFKMFRAEVGKRLFTATVESRYLFDLEVLELAHRLGYRIAEVPVHWREVPGGHLHPLRELPGIVAGLWRLRRKRK